MPIFVVFIIFRLVDFLISFFAPQFVPYAGFFPYKEMLPLTNLPPWIYSFANFDGLHYTIIADQGYLKYQEAFFPLYPILINIASYVTGKNFLVAGLLVTHIALFFALIFFKKLSTEIMPKHVNSWWPLAFLLTYPTSFFFGAVYTESLFFLFAVAYFYFLYKKQYALAGVFGFFATLTRLVGIFIVLHFVTVIVVQTLQELSKKKNLSIPAITSAFLDTLLKTKSMLYAFFLPIAGLLSYMSYLFVKTGDAIFFLTAQPSFGANRSTELVILPQVLYRYIKIFITAAPNFQYFMAVVEFTLFNLVFGVLLWQLWHLWKKKTDKNTGFHLGLNLFSMANMLLPTLTGTLSSTPRYGLMAISLYFVLATIPSKAVKIGIVVIFTVLHAVLTALFLQGYFVS